MDVALSAAEHQMLPNVGLPDLAGLPLCVDLDGTLVRTDTLHEMLIGASRDWRILLSLPLLLVRGRAALKDGLAAQLAFAPEHLPYNEPLLAWLLEQRATGRRLVLTTAASGSMAQAVATHLGIFDEVIASTPDRNLRGAAKAEALVERFGAGGFHYVGNDSSDLAVWARAAGAVLVGASPRLRARAQAVSRVDREFPNRRGLLRAIVRTLRVHQWSKNLLVFVPVVTARAMGDVASLESALLMFLGFSATASAIYVVNDLTDLSADRAHARKRQRPFASGELPVHWGLILAPVLLACGLLFGVASHALLPLVLYAAVSVAYSLRLKEYPLVDIFTLATLYTLRLYGGGVASGHYVSLWLLSFSSFLFLSLAAMKRVSELVALRETTDTAIARRGYGQVDLPVLIGLGCSAAMVSSHVLALYARSMIGEGNDLHAVLLWSIVPLVLFWQCRMWLATARGYMLDDPIVYAARDWVSRFVAVLLVVAFTVVAVSKG
jgi:4-hydroxybenzoate polyprenyltransferase